MEITIKFYGVHHFMANVDSITMPLTGETTAEDAFDWVKSRFPEMYMDKAKTIILLNTGRAYFDRVLKDKDEIAFIFDTDGK